MLAFTETKLIYIQNKGYRKYRVSRYRLVHTNVVQALEDIVTDIRT